MNQPNSLKLEEEKAEVLTNPASERKYVTQESRPTVLVVEDNTEMLHFIGQEINVHYNVVTAVMARRRLPVFRNMASN